LNGVCTLVDGLLRLTVFIAKKKGTAPAPTVEPTGSAWRVGSVKICQRLCAAAQTPTAPTPAAYALEVPSCIMHPLLVLDQSSCSCRQ
jgi:hypothetical protein